MRPILFEWAGQPVGSYGVFLAAGWLLGGLVFYRESQRRRWPVETMLFVMAGCALGGVMGASLFSALFLPHPALVAPGLTFDQRLGRTVVGGIIGGFAGVELTKKLLRYPHSTGAAFALAVPLGHALGRVGCLLAGCCFGAPTSLPWGVRYPAGSIVHTAHARFGWIDPAAAHSLAVHPAPLYELLFDLLLFAWLYRRRDDPRLEGQLFRLYLLGYATFRFLAEFARGDTRPFEGGLLKPVQLLLLASAVAVALRLRRALKARASEPLPAPTP